jgi:ABC-type multidrug transport system fused ATPase/permease subunit
MTGQLTLSRLLRAHWLVLGTATVLVLGGSAAGLMQPLLAGEIVQSVEHRKPLSGLVGWMLILVAGQLFMDTAGRYLLERAGHSVVRSTRTRLVSHLLRLRIAVVERQRVGDLVSRAGHDAGAMHELATRGFVDILVGGITTLVAVILMIRIDPVLFLIVTGSFAIAGAALVLMLGRIRAASQREHATVGALAADLERALGGIRTIRVSGAEDAEAKRLVRTIDDAYLAGMRTARLAASIAPAIQLAATGSFLLVLVIGAARVANGTIDLGALVTGLLYATYVVVPMANLLEGLAELKRSQGALTRVQETLDLQAEPVDDDAVPSAPPTPARPASDVVRFEGVSFGYDGWPVVEDLSFSVPAGSRTALVGPSGAGKSTVLALLCRFYEPDSGSIMYRGVPGAQLRVSDSRQMLALVEQDAPVTFDTVRDYLGLGGRAADDGRLRDVLQSVNLLDWLDGLDDGLDSVTGERGGFLSGGQRQRLAIARALLHPPALLLLDEPTSGLDPENENVVVSAVLNLPADCAVLMVTHRASTALAADQILVLDAGRIVAAGPHDHLLDQSPVYRRLFGEFQSGPSTPGRAHVHD